MKTTKQLLNGGNSNAYYPNYKISILKKDENLPIPNGTIGLSQIRDNKEKKWVLVKKDDSAALGFTYIDDIDDNDDEDLVSKIKEVKKKMSYNMGVFTPFFLLQKIFNKCIDSVKAYVKLKV